MISRLDYSETVSINHKGLGYLSVNLTRAKKKRPYAYLMAHRVGNKIQNCNK